MIYNKCNDIQIAFSMSAFLNHPHIYQWTMSNDDFDNHDDHASDADADYSLWLNVSFFHMYSTNMLILISRIMMLIMMMRMTILCVWIFHSSLLYVDLTSKSIKYYSNVGWSEIALLMAMMLLFMIMMNMTTMMMMMMMMMMMAQ